MAVLIGSLRRVQDVIDSALAQGCELRESKIKLMTPEGPKSVRYLYNPTTNGRFDISDYNNDEFMVQSEWKAAERRLSIALPALN